jgi:alpha-D-xyloside xylohydrolase
MRKMMKLASNPARICLRVLAIAIVGLIAGTLRCGAQANAGSRVQADGSTAVRAQDAFVLDRKDRTIVVEPYGPNIVRVTLSVNKTAAMSKPGYGFVASPSAAGWQQRRNPDGSDVLESDRLVVRVSPASTPAPTVMPRNEIYQHLIDQFFGSGGPNDDVHNDIISVSTPQGDKLLTVWRWSMYRNRKTSGSDITSAHADLDPGYKVSATFDAPQGEHYYGLGEHQMGGLDLRDREIDCWPDHDTLGGQMVCVPFMVSSRGYGLIWDNPSKTTVDLAVNQSNVWSSQVGDSISFFVIAGPRADDIYEGYRHLTGVTHLLPKGGYGYIQSKCVYPTQEQMMEVAKGYRSRDLPLDVLVVDFLHETKEGNMDLDPTRWPNPEAMNQTLHSMGMKTMISVWPHFATDSRYYDMLKQKGWFIQKADGSPDQSFWSNSIGPDIDTTNPAAAKWYWDVIKANYIQKDGFSYVWLDETEPDIDPEHDYFYIGSGARYYNVYPLFHTAAIYDGFRQDFGDSRRVMTLARASYLGAQRNGTVFWSSDITSSWDMLRRSVIAGLNFTASGMPYWDTDIGGYARREIYSGYQPPHKPLVSDEGAEKVVDDYSDFPELYVRWFQWGTFQPVMRAHGERLENEVWSYGKQATPILEKFLRMRYSLIPYTYSLAYQTYKTGAPFMRALWMDFPNDPNVATMGDEYMFGPAFLVAPVTAQGETTKRVYLPAGADWYNYWSHERYHGGQTITVAAPIDEMPLFVRAGSIIPIGSQVLDAEQKQSIAKVEIWPGRNADFDLYQDDGTTYAYENGDYRLTHLHWDDATGNLTHTGSPGWNGPDQGVVTMMGSTRNSQ